MKHRRLLTIVLFMVLWATTPGGSWAQTDQETAEKTFPGLTEVIPKANAVTTRITETGASVDQPDLLDDIDKGFAELEARLSELEKLFTSWDSAINWPLNRLMTAQVRYTELARQHEQLFKTFSERLSRLDELRNQWATEKEYWRDWQKDLQKRGIEIPQETFSRTRQSIGEQLHKIAKASSVLIEKQEQFSATQEILTTRLVLIDKTLDELRRETLRRNAYSLFSADFYQQLTPELFAQYRDNLVSTLQLPEGFWQRHGWVIGLQLICLFILVSLLLHRKGQAKPISVDWRFLFKHPIAGAFFITIATTGNLYDNIPPSWGWLMLAIATIAGTILVGAMTEKLRRKRLIRILAFIFLVSETLKVSGLPTPAYQLYEVILCAMAAPTCFLLARHRHRQEPGHFGIYLVSLSLISICAMIGLITALLGFVTLSTHLVDGVLSTIIISFMVKIAIHLADGGITEFLRLNWIRDRQLIQRLGLKTADRLKTLSRVFILVNAGLFLLVAWEVYSDVNEATVSLLNLEYTIGGFSISVFMMVTVALVLYLTNLISWFMQGVVDAHYMTPRRMDFGVKAALKRLLHYALFTIGFFIAVSMAGFDLQNLTIIAGALGVGIGFGLQNIVNNFVSGLILLFERPVKVGDTINIDDQWGTITKIGLRSTVFETLDRAEIIVPNSDLISEKVVNWTFTTNISRVVITVGVAYGSPLDEVLEILQRVAKEHPDILDEPESSAIFTGFGDSSIDFELRTWIADISKRLKVKSELGQAIDRYFREAGITIPFPQRDLHLRSIESNLQEMFKESKPVPER